MTYQTRTRIVDAIVWVMRHYVRYAPSQRGRGTFVRVFKSLKRLGWPPPILRLDNGLVMEFEPSLLGWTLAGSGEWEPDQTAVLIPFLKADQVVVNVGANTGYYTLLAAKRVGPRGHVHAFEIQPEISEILESNVARNGLRETVTINQIGCFSSNGEATIEAHMDPGSTSIAFGGQGARVQLVTLDRTCLAVV